MSLFSTYNILSRDGLRQRPSPSSTYSVVTVRYPHVVVPMPLLLPRQEQSHKTKSYSRSSKWLKLPRWLVSFKNVSLLHHGKRWADQVDLTARQLEFGGRMTC
jgi:hypothetical protein